MPGEVDLKDIQSMLTDAKARSETAQAEHKAALTEVKGTMAEIAAANDANTKETSEQKESFQSATERLVRVEGDMQKASDALARLTANLGSTEAKTIAQLLEGKTAEMKGHSQGEGGMRLIHVDTKDITSDDASAGLLIQPQRDTTPIMALQTRLWLRDLLTVVPVSSNAVEWIQEKSRTNNADIQVNEGDTKPQSTIDFEAKSASVVTIAHWTRQSRQVMQDVPQLAGIIEEMLRYGLNAKEEIQLLSGAGTGGNMMGIVPQSTVYTSALGGEVATDTRIDRIRRAMMLVEDDLYPASGIIMNHRDWAEVEMQKTDDKAYLFANPVNATAPRLWGLPVVSAPSMAAGSWMLGGFAGGATLYDREQTTVRVADMDGTDFVENMLKVLVEKRVMIAVKRPASFYTGDFVGV